MSAVVASFWLITSGAYVNQELAAEFGQLPPVFLPVGTKRLFEYQLAWIGQDSPVFLTVPEDYNVSDEDRCRLKDLGAETIAMPVGLSLGESVLFALNLIGGNDRPVRIIHGDTLIDDSSLKGLDEIGVAASAEGYSWAEASFEQGRLAGLKTVQAGAANDPGRCVACGYFAFAHSASLVRSLTRSRGRFVDAILDYAAAHPLASAFPKAWYDFGHVQTFFRSRRIVTSARHFNLMHIDGRTARKASADHDKIWAEANWLQTVPASVRIYTARLIDSGEDASGHAFYETEYAYHPTLSELFVYGALGASAWREILDSCRDFLGACAAAKTTIVADPLLEELSVAKTKSRLERFAQETDFKIGTMLRYGGMPLPSLLQIAEDVVQHIDFASGRWATVMHGDFCFSNILYDSRVRRIRVIDPRGYVAAGQPSTAGDIRYDMAKFTHSVVGRYDQIIAGRYKLEVADEGRFLLEFEQAPHQAWLENEMTDFAIDGINAGSREVRAICVCLFLSMLPLHADRPDRQKAFVANALRLYAGLEAGTS